MSKESLMKNENVNLYIYHHNDLDGHMASTCIAAMFSSDSVKETKFIKVAHGVLPLDLSIVKTDENSIVYILDYSISTDDEKEKLNSFIEENGHNVPVIYIDHHQTSLGAYVDYPAITKCINEFGCINTAVSATVLCDLYAMATSIGYLLEKGGANIGDYLNLVADVIRSPESANKHLENSQYWVQLTNDWDTFSNKLPNSRAFNLGCTNAGLPEMRSNIVRYLRLQDEESLNEFIDSLIEDGLTIEEYQKKVNLSVMRNAFTCKIEFDFPSKLIDETGMLELPEHVKMGGKFICVNGYGNSLVFGEEIENYDGVIIFNYNGPNNIWMYNMYSRKENGFQCNMAATFFSKLFKLNGGGHYHAAGWSAPTMLFEADGIYKFTDLFYVRD